MVALLVACLISVPTDCRTHEIPLVESMPVMQWMEAETRAIQWLEQHPGMEKKSLRVLPGRAA